MTANVIMKSIYCSILVGLFCIPVGGGHGGGFFGATLLSFGRSDMFYLNWLFRFAFLLGVSCLLIRNSNHSCILRVIGYQLLILGVVMLPLHVHEDDLLSSSVRASAFMASILVPIDVVVSLVWESRASGQKNDRTV